MEKQEIIKVQTGLMDPRGFLLPRGVREQLTAEIADGVATFRFIDGKNTLHFAKVVIGLEKKRGANDTIYLERFQKIITKYPGKTKEEIRDLLLKQLKQLGANVK